MYASVKLFVINHQWNNANVWQWVTFILNVTNDMSWVIVFVILTHLAVLTGINGV